MKKVLYVLFIGLISIMVFPFNANAESISTLDVVNNNNKLTVSGTTENGVLAIAVLVYSGEDLIHMETCSNNNNSYSCKLSKTFGIGNYTVKVADYDGGDYISKNVSINTAVNNPQTMDNIINYVVFGGVSLISIMAITFYLKKKKIFS